MADSEKVSSLPSEREEEIWPAWRPLSERRPEVKQAVLVKADAWITPRVLVYDDFPFPRLIDRMAAMHYWYPERMHWMPLPPPPQGA